MNEEALLPDLDATSKSIFPHFFLCLLLTLLCTWFIIDFEIFSWGYLQVGMDESDDGMSVMFLAGKALEFSLFHGPFIFAICLMFAYYSCEHSCAEGDPKWVMLAKGILGLGLGCLVVLVLEWVLTAQARIGAPHSVQEIIVAYTNYLRRR